MVLILVTQPGEGRSDDETDYVIIEGDIQVTREFYERLIQARHVGAATTYVPSSADLWPNGTVPYAFDANVKSANRQLMLDAMEEWRMSQTLTL